jgi:hypothetical protein
MPDLPLRYDAVLFTQPGVLDQFVFGMQHIKVCAYEGLVMMVEDDRHHIGMLGKNVHPVRDGQAGHAALDDDVAFQAYRRNGFFSLAFGVCVQDGRAILAAPAGFVGDGFRRTRVVHLRLQPADVGSGDDDERLHGNFPHKWEEGID